MALLIYLAINAAALVAAFLVLWAICSRIRDVTVVDATGYSHADVSQRLGTAGDSVVTPPVTTFLQSCLA